MIRGKGSNLRISNVTRPHDPGRGGGGGSGITPVLWMKGGMMNVGH